MGCFDVLLSSYNIGCDAYRDANILGMKTSETFALYR